MRTEDALRELGSERYDVVLSNPPFGRESSILVVGEGGDTVRESTTQEREDFDEITAEIADDSRSAQAEAVLGSVSDEELAVALLRSVPPSDWCAAPCVGGSPNDQEAIIRTIDGSLSKAS